MEGGIGHGVSLPVEGRSQRAETVYTRPHASSSAWPDEPSRKNVTSEIVVNDYDPNWPDWFETVRRSIWPVIEDIAVRIDHVGSTAVPGLAAKPIIDMDIVVESCDRVRLVIGRLASIGYRWRGDLGVVGREAFEMVPAKSLPAHHLYLVVENNRAHVDHWLLRDFLRDDVDARERYAALKRQNAEARQGRHRPLRRGQSKPRCRAADTGTCAEGTAARDVLGPGDRPPLTQPENRASGASGDCPCSAQRRSPPQEIPDSRVETLVQ